MVNLLKKEPAEARAVLRPASSVRETEKEFVVTLDMPGADKKGISVSYESGRLEIRASRTESNSRNETWLLRERREGEYQKVFSVDAEIDEQAIRADYREGVLTLTLPKAASAQPRRIPVE